MIYIYLIKAKNKAAYKIGITRSPKRRIKEINQDVPCRLLFAVPVLFAEWFEGYLHNRYKALQRQDMEGTGKTEWFYFWLPIRPAFWILGFFVLQVSILILILLLLIKSIL